MRSTKPTGNRPTTSLEKPTRGKSATPKLSICRVSQDSDLESSGEPSIRTRVDTLKLSPNRISHDSIDDVLNAFDNVSRRITDLARELKCLGYFDDDHQGRPRAA